MKSKKLLYIDLETSGLSPTNNGILQIACIYEVDGEVKDTFNSYMKPPKGTVYDDAALEINGLTKKKIKKFRKSADVFMDFRKFLDSKVDRYDKTDKMVMVAYNAHFDKSFLDAWAISCGYKYLHAYIDYRMIDILMLARVEWYRGKLNPPDFKLATVCAEYDIEISSAHNAVADILATRELFMEML